jgi:CRISPR-associated protein Cas1
MRACLEGDIPILWFSSGGWFAGYSIAHGGSWVARRIAQVERARGESSVVLARAFVAGKIRNQRTLLRRLGADGAAVAVGQLAGLITRIESASTLGELLGVEGTAARVYFGALPGLLKSAGDELTFKAAIADRRLIRSTRCCRSPTRCWCETRQWRHWPRGWTRRSA